MFGLHYGFGRLGVRLAWLGPRGGGMRGKQLLAQHSNITIGGFMNINMPPFVVREQRGCRVVSNLLQGAGDRVETFRELTSVAELHVPLHVAEVEALNAAASPSEIGRFETSRASLRRVVRPPPRMHLFAK